MKLSEMKDWVNKLPEEFMDFSVVNGEYGTIDDEIYYRVDKPITTMTVDIETKEILILNDTNEEVIPGEE